MQTQNQAVKSCKFANDKVLEVYPIGTIGWVARCSDKDGVYYCATITAGQRVFSTAYDSFELAVLALIADNHNQSDNTVKYAARVLDID